MTAKTKNWAGQLIKSAQRKSGMSLRELGRRAGTSHATLSAYIKGTKSPTTATLERIIDTCDLSLDFSLRPRIREMNGLSRGEELAAALHLAGQFPARPNTELNYPVFHRQTLSEPSA